MEKLNGVYNKGVFWPDGIDCVINHVLSFQYIITSTFHAKERMRYYHLPLGCVTALLYGEPVEAYFENGRLWKIVVRLANRFNPEQDICGAIVFDGKYAHVLTVWLNNGQDNHYTIRKENYVQKIF